MPALREFTGEVLKLWSPWFNCFITFPQSLIQKNKQINFVETNNLPWMDIDEEHELAEAKKIYQNMSRVDS